MTIHDLKSEYSETFLRKLANGNGDKNQLDNNNGHDVDMVEANIVD